MAEETNPLDSAVNKIESKMVAFKDEVVTKAKAEVEKLAPELKAMNDKLIEITADSTKKGATILQMMEDVTDIKAKAGRLIATQGNNELTLVKALETQIVKNADRFIKMAGQGDGSYDASFEIKVGTVTTSSLGGQAYGTYLPAGPGLEPIGQVRFRDLPGVRTIDSATDTVYYPRANTPVGTGSFGKQVTEAAAKAQVDRGYTNITLTLYPYAGYIQVSRQSLRNIPFMQSWLPISLEEQLKDFEDLDFSQTVISAATGTASSTGANTAEKLVYDVANLIKTKFPPNCITVDPTLWVELLITRPSGSSNYSVPLGFETGGVALNAITGQLMFLGVPVYPVNWLSQRRFLMGDFTKVAIVQSEGLTLRQSNDVNDAFIKNVVTFLLERVEGVAIFRTDAFITGVL